jgi:hypothetical protein
MPGPPLGGHPDRRGGAPGITDPGGAPTVTRRARRRGQSPFLIRFVSSVTWL